MMIVTSPYFFSVRLESVMWVFTSPLRKEKKRKKKQMASQAKKEFRQKVIFERTEMQYLKQKVRNQRWKHHWRYKQH